MRKQHKKNKSKTIQHNKVKACLLLSLLNIMPIGLATAYAADNETKSQTKPSTAKTYNIPAGNLGEALPAYAAETGVLLGFDPKLTQGKETGGLKGNYSTQEGFKELLKGTGLEIVNDQRGGYYLDKAAPAPAPKDNVPSLGESPKEYKLDKINVRAKRFHEIGPLPGLGLTKEEIPGNVQSITAKEIKESHSLSITDLMNKKLQSVNVNDYQGNPFQMDVTYRGFTAGPQIGTPQGLSVFLDGIRVNEPFGDVVNWDMIPMNAIAGVDVFPGSNPIFGLNTLGGAFTLKTKDGFTNEGVDAEILAGSYGRKQLQVEGGINNGTFALFGAGNFFLEDGWRDNSPSKVNQFFGKASYRGDKLDLNLSTLLVGTDLVGNGLLPSEMYAQKHSSVFTSPDTTKNKLSQFQLSGAFQVNDNFNITGQVYRRNSNRKQLGADVYTEFGNQKVLHQIASGEQYTCLYESTNKYGIPDYYIVDINDPADQFSDPFIQSYQSNGNVPDMNFLDGIDPLTGVADPTKSLLNKDIPPELLPYFLQQYNRNKNFIQSNLYIPQADRPDDISSGDTTDYSYGEASFLIKDELFSFLSDSSGNDSLGVVNPMLAISGAESYFYTPIDPDDFSKGGIKHLILFKAPINRDKCLLNGVANIDNAPLRQLDADGRVIYVDGALNGTKGVAGGAAETPKYTPTAVLTNTQIDQVVDGASLQFNWNLEHHKFMVGLSIDKSTADYSSGQRLGLLDAQRNAYLAPDLIRDEYAAADLEVSNNNFSGESITKSIYASETWSPIDSLHFTGAARYNDTHGKNKIASRSFGFTVADLANFLNFPDTYNTCTRGTDGNLVCPTTGYKLPDISKLLNKAETEKFSYYSLNPSLGATWQAKENLNVYANWAKGTRTPSVIELGCALDKTPIENGTNIDGSPRYTFKGILENRSCSLPSTLSGDPYLPQIKATSYDIGMRGNIGENMQWNLGAYQTDLKDDIYFVTFENGRGFFDTIGKTRRRGIEAGFSAKQGKASFSLNYGLTDARFEDEFVMASENNSSSYFDQNLQANVIKVKPGSRMPGVPLHNLNASVTYAITPKWRAGLSAVVHSESIVRGNENNEHQVGGTVSRIANIEVDTSINPNGYIPVTVTRQTSNPGKVPGYATFNFQTSYQFNKEWSASMLVNNLFDKEYFSAGRLGQNPFSPNAVGGAAGEIGVSGYNHNSSNWLSTNFIAPSAPRGFWFSLNWQFDAKKDNVTSESSTLTEPSEVEKPYQPLPPPLHRYQGAPQVEE